MHYRLFAALAAVLVAVAPALAQVNLEPGNPAPSFFLYDRHGQEQFLSDYVGKPRASKPRAPRQVVLINFFGVNCKPCEEEIPYLKGLLKQYEKDGLQLILIAKDKRELVQAYIDQRQLHEPIVLVDEYEQVFKKYLVTGIPMLYLVAPDGKIVLRRFGFDHRDNLHLETSLRKLFKRPEPKPSAKPSVKPAAKPSTKPSPSAKPTRR